MTDVACQIYFYLKDLGIDQNPDALVYKQLPGLKMKDIVDFQKSTIRNFVYDYAVLGDPKGVDRPTLDKLGKVVEVKVNDLFGF